MNNRELRNIIEEIKLKEGIFLNDIADKARINRSYLSKFINSEKIKPVTGQLLGKMQRVYNPYFKDNKNNRPESPNSTTLPPNKIDEILANLSELRDYTIAILTGQSAGHEIMMGSLDRLEHNEEGTLSAAADKLALQFAARLKMIQKDRKAEASK